MKIAMIDDESTVLKINEIMLKKIGAIFPEDTVVKHLDAETFFSSYRSGECDIIICDNDMGTGKMRGSDMLALLRDTGCSDVLVLLTGDDSLSLSLRMQNEKNIQYVVKNISNGDDGMISVLGRIIESTRKQVEK